MRTVTSAIVIAAVIAGQVATPLYAQTRPAPQPETRPMPLPEPVTRPTPLPGPVTPLPGPVIDRPTPLPGPVTPLPGPITQPTPLPGPVIDRPTPLPGPVAGNGGYAGTLRCESRSNRLQRCGAQHQNRVALIDRHDGKCNQGSDWGYDRRAIWVARGCKATFAYGYGNYWPEAKKDKGSDTGLIIGGVVIAAGLVALLASKSKKKAPAETTTPTPGPEKPTTFPPGPPAAIDANLSALTAEQRPAMQTCLFEASREVGVTGGSKLKLDKVTEAIPGNGGWRFRANLIATYPDGDRELPIYCRATSTKVVQLDFGS